MVKKEVSYFIKIFVIIFFCISVFLLISCDKNTDTIENDYPVIISRIFSNDNYEG